MYFSKNYKSLISAGHNPYLTKIFLLSIIKMLGFRNYLIRRKFIRKNELPKKIEFQERMKILERIETQAFFVFGKI
ncbi:MAG: hypothetical protein COX43_02335 [Parcubacteria group bacterium CG23_combo_of_CG06-09_8_20_14_all_35_9]|nr:MAG: hypothetical protein COX43_02335 [Parcubacteria group bacterium CG23_combo_of_CG06-09_8_20_14_all_35_9]